VLSVDEPVPGARAHAADAAARGYREGIAHDYKRHGTTTLFAALDVLRGTGLTDCLVAKTDHFVTHYNKHRKPLLWTATADSGLEKLERFTSRISGTGH
jgi:hypothetical protein